VTKLQLKSAPIAVAALAIAIGGAVIGKAFIDSSATAQAEQTNPQINQRPVSLPASESSISIADSTVHSATIQPTTTQPAAVDSDIANEEQLPYTAESIYAALQQVNLDTQGNLVVDHAALLALRRTMGHRGLILDTLELAELQSLIEVGLPGEAGQQVAYIAGKYYNYLQAKNEYLELHRDAGTAKDFNTAQEQLQRLRHIHLGETLTRQLFSRSDAENTYFYERFKIASDRQLSPAEQQQKIAAASQRYRIGMASSLGLQDKYQSYLQQQQLLQKSQAIDNQEQQLQQLWQDTFSQQEQAALRAVNIHPGP
jgi:hypothetical protein